MNLQMQSHASSIKYFKLHHTLHLPFLVSSLLTFHCTTEFLGLHTEPSHHFSPLISFSLLFALWQIPKAIGMSVVHSKSFRCCTNCKQSSARLESYNPVYQSNRKGEHNPELKRRGKERWHNSASNFGLGNSCISQQVF